MKTLEQAIAHLKTIDPTTVIDWNWNDIIELETRTALCVLTSLPSYWDINNEYEGYTIPELIDAFTPRPSLTIYCDNTNTAGHYPNSAGQLEALQEHIAKFLRKNSYVVGRIGNNISSQVTIIK